jgi:hypothetical protein
MGLFASAASESGFGLNLAYNALDFLRLHAGAGDQHLTAGAQLLLPRRGLTPVAGAGAHRQNEQFEAFVSGGLDWQAESGFNVGASVEYLPRVAEAQPSVRLGWYF